MSGARLESGRSRYEPGLRWVLLGSSHTSDLNIGIPVAPLPDAWCFIGSALGLVSPVSVYRDWVKRKALICSFCVAARKIVWADPPLKYTSVWKGTLINKLNKQSLYHQPHRWPCVRRPPREREISIWTRLALGSFGVESYQWLKHWHSSGSPARRLVL